MERALSVAFLMQDFSGGGVEKMRIALAAGFLARGYRVHLVVAHATGALAGHVPAGAVVADLDAGGPASAVMRLRAFLKRAKPDVLISSLDHNNVVALLASFGRPRMRVVICQHNALSRERVLGWRYRLIPALYWLLQSRADGIVAVSCGVADDLASTAHLPRHRITALPNPAVDLARLPSASAQPPHPWFTDRTQPVFVFVGRLAPQKDPLFLLRAFTRRLAHGPARLVVLGEGPLAAEMAAFVSRQDMGASVFMAGYLVDPLPWIAQADALLLTSRYEGFGNVIAEALACGTPVIATDCPYGPSEILENGQFGRLIAVGDEAAFAGAMREDLRAIFPAAALRKRGACYTVAHSVAALEALVLQMKPRHLRLFGIPVSDCGQNEIVTRLLSGAAEKLRLVVTPNLNHVRLLRRHDFRGACRSADVVALDGWPLALYARWRGGHLAGAVTGCDILHALLRDTRLATMRVLVVAESSSTAIVLRNWLAARRWYDNWEVAVSPRDLLRDCQGQDALVATIGRVRPDILIMTLGAPVSEVFVHRHREALPPLWALCIGQAFRVELGLVHRAPAAWRKLGAEWAWRCLQEPRRLGPRYLKDAAWFPMAVLRDLAGGWR